MHHRNAMSVMYLYALGLYEHRSIHEYPEHVKKIGRENVLRPLYTTLEFVTDCKWVISIMRTASNSIVKYKKNCVFHKGEITVTQLEHNKA